MARAFHGGPWANPLLTAGVVGSIILLTFQSPAVLVDGRRLPDKSTSRPMIASLLSDTQEKLISDGVIPNEFGSILRARQLQEALVEAVDASLFDGVSVSIGTQEGLIFSHQKGDTAPQSNETLIVASASKWVSGMMITYLMQEGLVTMDMKASDALDYWSTTGNMGNVTLMSLLSMTSGLNPSSNSTCLSTTPYIGIQACAREIYESYTDLEFEPGTVFQYSNQNLEISAAIAEAVTNKTWAELYHELVVEPLQLEDYTMYDSIGGPDYGLHISTGDYIRILKGRLLTPYSDQASPGALSEASMDMMNKDLTPLGQVEFDIEATPQGWFGEDVFPSWHYSVRHWVECPDGPQFPGWSQRCTDNSSKGVHSSMGALGFYPIIDYRQRQGLDVSSGLYIVISPAFTGSPMGDNPAMVTALQTGAAIRKALDAFFPLQRDS